MGAREQELFEALRMREAKEAGDDASPGTPDARPDAPIPSFGSGRVVLTRRTILLLTLAALALCVLSGFVGYALAS
jgi:hypothetical protein